MDGSLQAKMDDRTLQELLSVSRKDLQEGLTRDKLIAAAQDGQKEFGAWLGKANWSTVSGSMASHVEGFLQDDLAGVFAGAWAKYSELRKCAEETKDNLGSTSTVALADHKFSYELSPTIDLLLNKVVLTSLPFGIAVAFAVSGLELELKAGCVHQVHCGKCSCEAHIDCGGQTIWTRQPFEFDVPGKLQLRKPISLLPSALETGISK